MPYISQSEYSKYLEYKKLIDNGRILTPSGITLICESHNNDPTEIGKHMLMTKERNQ